MEPVMVCALLCLDATETVMGEVCSLESKITWPQSREVCVFVCLQV